MMLKCNSTDCIFNDQGGGCFASNISVTGRNAKTTSETNCATYQSKSDQNTEFANDFMEMGKREVKNNNIICDALNCAYNKNTSCMASNVQINSGDASCETFRL